jgi:hypothetical protein
VKNLYAILLWVVFVCMPGNMCYVLAAIQIDKSPTFSRRVSIGINSFLVVIVVLLFPLNVKLNLYAT